MADPFVLTPEQLRKAELTLAYYSPKTGAGKQHIVIGGEVAARDQVKVRLCRSPNRDAPLDERVGAVPAISFERLLAYFAEENFLGLNEEYPAPPPTGARTLRLVIPDHDHRVAVAYPAACPEFERLAGATKLLAALALPEALGHAFLANL